MTQLAAQLAPLDTEDTALRDEYSALRAQIREECDTRWNGCDTCDGRGWVVTWDTLDCIRGSYAEYGSCSNEACTAETREASGLKVRSSKYDRNRGTSVMARGTEEQEARRTEIRDLLGANETTRNELTTLWAPNEGKMVRIVRAGGGPKARRPVVGTVGLVIKKFSNNWGTEKLIVLDTDGVRHWPSIKMVEVTDPSPADEVKAPYEAILSGEKKAELEEKGYPAIVTVTRRAAKAAMVITSAGAELWIPYSQVEALRDAAKGATVAVVIPGWLAKNKGLLK